jgi:two-component system, NtrC family, sensor kinase
MIFTAVTRRRGVSKDGAPVNRKIVKKKQSPQRRKIPVSKANADLHHAVDSFSDMICILDGESRITHVNRSFSERLNKPYKKIVGSYCYEVLHSSRKPLPTCPFRAVMQTGQPMQVTGDFEIGDGLFTASIIPFYDAAGGLHGAVHIFREIDELKKAKNKSVQSEKMTAIGTLAAEIAHEINNPLHYINNYLYLISESLPPDFSNRDYLDKIQSGLDSLVVLTRDLLEFARPRLDVFVPVDVHRIMDTSLELAAKAISEKRVGIIKQYECIDKQVLGSDDVLQQVFANLIQNALDSMTMDGSITIQSSCKKNLLTLKIGDSGTGIPRKNISKIFDPFFTTKKNAPKRGTGLGLSICYNIIKQLQGDITVSSEEGTGTTFTITLPFITSK